MGDEISEDDYPSLRVITSPEIEEDDALQLDDTPKFFDTGYTQNFDTSNRTAEDLALRQFIGGIGCGSLRRIRVHSNDSSLDFAPNSAGGFGSLVSSPDHVFEGESKQGLKEDVSNLVPSTNHSPRSNYEDYYDDSPVAGGHYNADRIDTKAPIESVKDAVSKFGGIVDWKAHKIQSAEKLKIIKAELEKAHAEIPKCKKECADAEEDRFQVMKELQMTKEHVEELKLNLERTQTEEYQTKQDFEQTKLRLEEYGKGNDNVATFSAKAQLEIANTRHKAAVSELNIVKDELAKMQSEFYVLASDRDTAVKKAGEAATTTKELERRIENLAVELTTLKGALEAARAEHLEGEKVRSRKAMEINQEMVDMEKELKEAEQDLGKIDPVSLKTKDLRSKIDAATTLLQRLKVELATYMDSKLSPGNDDDKVGKHVNRPQNNLHAAITSAKKELEQVKASIEYRRNEVTCLKVLASSLQSEGLVASYDGASREAELNAMKSQVRKTMEEAAQANVVARAMESRLLEAKKEIEVAKNSNNNENIASRVTLSMGEYLKLKNQAQKSASEVDNLRTLEETKREIVERKAALQTALQKAEIAKKGKLEAEEKWRNMKAEHEQKQRKAGQNEAASLPHKIPKSPQPPIQGTPKSPPTSSQGSAAQSPKSPQSPIKGLAQAPIKAQVHTQEEIEQNYKEILSLETSVAKKKKKFGLPKFFMFMGRKKESP